jgi:hypothetical protein
LKVALAVAGHVFVRQDASAAIERRRTALAAHVNPIDIRIVVVVGGGGGILILFILVAFASLRGSDR